MYYNNSNEQYVCVWNTTSIEAVTHLTKLYLNSIKHKTILNQLIETNILVQYITNLGIPIVNIWNMAKCIGRTVSKIALNECVKRY